MNPGHSHAGEPGTEILILIWDIWYLKAFFIKKKKKKMGFRSAGSEQPSQLLRNLRQKGCRFKGILDYRVSSAWLAWTT